MRGSRLPAGGENVLQTIRVKRGAAEAAGVKLLDLSIGEPKGAAFPQRQGSGGGGSDERR